MRNVGFIVVTAGLATNQVVSTLVIAYDPPTKDFAKSINICIGSILLRLFFLEQLKNY